ncbi:hypothetical protein ETB97_006918 [Aspergillus alliaceus]|uniref:Uncharacterized protein n=1 Tax=Petromyces alliaceus TaxID=209559 RepID=A0A8H6AGF1_PETAA|nr:hypothetical protein ETB97_006918 [Aspergillus burnettii]
MLQEAFNQKTEITTKALEFFTLKHALPNFTRFEKFIFRFEQSLYSHEAPTCYWDVRETLHRHLETAFMPTYLKALGLLIAIRSLELSLRGTDIGQPELELIGPVLEKMEGAESLRVPGLPCYRGSDRV